MNMLSEANKYEVSICGVKHDVVFEEDKFTSDAIHFGEIDYKKCEITLSKGMAPQLVNQVLTHEMLHGILTAIGYSELANDEHLVQALAQAVSMSFDVKIKNK